MAVAAAAVVLTMLVLLLRARPGRRVRASS
jgi:hypothetical protein